MSIEADSLFFFKIGCGSVLHIGENKAMISPPKNG